MKMKLTKIVYDHTDEGVKVVNHYEPCDDDDAWAGVVVSGDKTRLEFLYTRQEWEDALYWILGNNLPIQVVKAIDEVSHG